MENVKNTKKKKTVRNIAIGVAALALILFLGFKEFSQIFIGIFAISSILFIHELGHYLAARAVKMPVYEFSVGIGPKIYSKTIDDIQYNLRCIPLGGYVVLEEIKDDEDDETEVETTDSYRKAHPLKRALVVLAGPAFNFLYSYIIITGLLIHGGYTTNTIGVVLEDGAAQEYGLQEGDTILSINGVEIKSWEDTTKVIASNEELSFKVDRNGEEKVIDVKAKMDEQENRYKVGISPYYKKDILKSIKLGVNGTVNTIKLTVEGYVEIVKNIFVKEKESEVELIGPVGTIQTMSKSVSYGISNLLLMVFSMSVSIGVFNLIPVIPNLDGGRFLFIIIEILRGGKQFSKKTEENILVVGALAVLVLFGLITLNDLINLF